MSKSHTDWWKEKIEIQINMVKDLEDKDLEDKDLESKGLEGKELKKKDRNDLKFRTMIKLQILTHFVSIYTRILGKENTSGDNTGFRFEELVYIDLFSGSGKNEVNFSGKNISSAGSPLIAINSSHQKFTKMIFVEQNKERNTALKSTLKKLESLAKTNWIEGKCNVLSPEDVNVHISRISEEVGRRNTHSLIFIDPYGMELNFLNFEKILKTKSDIVFYYNNNLNWRAAQAAKSCSTKGKEKHHETLNLFFGGEEWETAKTPDELFKQYLKKVMKHRPVIKILKVKETENKILYSIIICVKRTPAGNPWMKAIEKDLKPRIDYINERKVKELIKTIVGINTELDDFVESNKRSDDSKNKNKKLNEFFYC